MAEVASQQMVEQLLLEPSPEPAPAPAPAPAPHPYPNPTPNQVEQLLLERMLQQLACRGEGALLGRASGQVEDP